MKEWIFVLDGNDLEALGTVRCLNSLMAAADNDKIWLRGVTALAEPDNSLRRLPLKKTFLLDDNGNLFPEGALTPTDILPQLEWQPISEFLNVTAPVSSLPGKTNEQVAVKLILSEKIREGDALLISLSIWKDFAAKAAEARLNAVSFAVSEKNEVVIVGKPLPPLPGKEYWISHNFLVPCGYDFEIPLIAKLLTGKPGYTDDSWILFDSNGSWQKIPKEYFVTGSRSAARLTAINKPSD